MAEALDPAGKDQLMTGIEWTEVTWNPLVGCTAVSEGCTNCYAISMANRLQGRARRCGSPAHYEGLVRRSGGRTVWTGRVNMAPRDVVEKPLRWRKPRLVFVNSMSDIFHESVCDADIMDIMGVMMRARRHTFQVLTKRPWRMNELSYIGAMIGIARHMILVIPISAPPPERRGQIGSCLVRRQHRDRRAI